MRFAITAAFLVPLAACAAVGTDPVAEVPTEVPGAPCRSAALASFTGQPASAELGARMLRESGATKLRWVAKGMMVTMDYRGDRLTVYLDATNRIERASCG